MIAEPFSLLFRRLLPPQALFFLHHHFCADDGGAEYRNRTPKPLLSCFYCFLPTFFPTKGPRSGFPATSLARNCPEWNARVRFPPFFSLFFPSIPLFPTNSAVLLPTGPFLSLPGFPPAVLAKEIYACSPPPRLFLLKISPPPPLPLSLFHNRRYPSLLGSLSYAPIRPGHWSSRGPPTTPSVWPGRPCRCLL